MTGQEAHVVLRLVHEHLLRSVGDQHGQGPTDLLTAHAGRGLATDVTPDPDQPHHATVRPHPTAADPADR